MGLFEVIQRIANKFGLLSKMVRILPGLSLLFSLAGIALLAMLPMEGQFRNTYISENALLPAQASTYFRESEWNIVRGYRHEVHMLESANSSTRTEAIQGWFEDIGLKTSVQDWEMSYGSEKRSGSNVYGILHAPRGENTEAMVLVAPWLNQDGEYNDGGISLVVALARYLSKWSVWSKNVIFVVTSDSHLAMRSWVSAYHSSLGNTAGEIEAAIVLDYPSKSDHFESLEVVYEGLNGQLPNLDLVNTAIKIARLESIPVVIQGLGKLGYQFYTERALAFFRGILSQLSAGIRPGPGSDTFSGYRINAITIRAKGTEGWGDITTFGRVAESTLRSINNLMEHFHQSFFFYFLMTPQKFVSIGTYLPAVLLVSISYPLMAFYNIATKFMTAEQNVSILDRKTILLPFILLSSIYLGCFVFGFSTLHILSSNAVVTTIMALSIAQAVYTIKLLISVFKSDTGTAMETAIQLPASALSFAHAYAMIVHGLILTILGMINFSLGFFLGVVTLPLTWLRPLSHEASPAQRRHHYIVSAILLTVSTPWLWLKIISFLSSHDDLPITASKHDLYNIVDNLLWGWRGLDVWTWGVISGVWLPLWLVGVSIVIFGQGSAGLDIDEKVKVQ